jgi:hypothetical protein
MGNALVLLIQVFLWPLWLCKSEKAQVEYWHYLGLSGKPSYTRLLCQTWKMKLEWGPSL